MGRKVIVREGKDRLKSQIQAGAVSVIGWGRLRITDLGITQKILGLIEAEPPPNLIAIAIQS